MKKASKTSCPTFLHAREKCILRPLKLLQGFGSPVRVRGMDGQANILCQEIVLVWTIAGIPWQRIQEYILNQTCILLHQWGKSPSPRRGLPCEFLLKSNGDMLHYYLCRAVFEKVSDNGTVPYAASIRVPIWPSPITPSIRVPIWPSPITPYIWAPPPSLKSIFSLFNISSCLPDTRSQRRYQKLGL